MLVVEAATFTVYWTESRRWQPVRAAGVEETSALMLRAQRGNPDRRLGLRFSPSAHKPKVLGDPRQHRMELSSTTGWSKADGRNSVQAFMSYSLAR